MTPDREDDASGGAPTIADSWPTASAPVTDEVGGSALSRYRLGEVIGRGGMGEVISARDEQIGRSVAIKRLRGKDPGPVALGRFLREARIQGRLDHPAIVPVHELWRDGDGQPFFVMKQLTGVTLQQVIVRLAAGDEAITARFPRQRLLRAFSEICLAIEFAHTRGVIHRDLKPANIVLGDFGEVYILDWGIARVTGDGPEAGGFADIDTIEGTETEVGVVLGTPGYASPEQIRGDAGLDGRADVYALGCMLFEILSLEAMHPRGQPGLASALSGIEHRPSERAPDRDVPPELDAITVRATAVHARDRFATARELGDAVLRYLDGDRDVALRRNLVQTELAVARAAFASGNAAMARRAALRAAARALALDPTAEEPAELMARLMLEPPADTPREVEAEIERLDLDSLRASARFGTLAALTYILFWPILLWIGFRAPWFMIGGPVLCGLIIWVEVTLAGRNPFWSGYLAIAGHLVMFVMLARITTPVLIGAGPATIMVMLLGSHPRLIRTWVLALIAAGATMLPLLLELAGVLSPTIAVRGNTIVLTTGAKALEPVPTILAIVLYMLTLVLLATLVSRGQDDERKSVRRAQQIQAWQLRQLVPRPESAPPKSTVAGT